MTVTPSIYAIATMDSKGEEIHSVADTITQMNAPVVLVDVGTKSPPVGQPDISREEVAACHPSGADYVFDTDDRGEAVTRMSEALVEFVSRDFASGKISGLIGLGGTGGTALIAPAMRALPIGVPKVLVSTVASGNTAPYVDCCDITMMYSVVDVAGLNRVSTRIFANAARAIAAMATGPVSATADRPTLGMTMFGVTTPCVTRVREAFEAKGYDCLVFHATGAGGRAMEKLVESGMIDGVLDITTTEVADEVVGGIFKAGKERFDRILKKEIPYVLSVGAMDMVNFAGRDTVPEQFNDRNLYVHNAQITLMRTTPEENRQMAEWLTAKLNRSTSPLALLIPEKGVSLIDAPDQPFHDPEANAALFGTLEATLDQNEDRRILKLPLAINDDAFADALVETFLEVQAKIS